MSKNQRVIIASVGILSAMILAVFLIRSPAERQVSPEPVKQETASPKPKVEEPPKKMDDMHNRVASIVDDASEAVAKEVPGLWGRVKDSWDWFMGFDAKHAIILIAVAVFVLGILASGGGRNKRSQH